MSGYFSKEILQKIEPEDAQDYLISSGWIESDKIKNKAIVYSRDDAYSDVIVPISRSVSDYAIRYAELVNIISEISNKNPQDVLQDILYYGSDIARFRIASPKTQDGTIPLDDAAKFYNNVKQVVISSALSVIQTKPKYSSSIPQKVKELYDRSKIGQTEVGSYVISVIIRHSKKSQEASGRILEELPFERLTFENMNRALSRIDEITEVDLNENRVNESVFDGVSYNFCKHLAEIQEITYGGELDIDFQWSGRYKKPENLKDNVVIEYQQKAAIERAAEILGSTTQTSRKTLYGMVIGLLRPEGYDEGKVTVNTIYEGRSIKVSMMLKLSDYLQAVKAHENELQIKFSGDIDRAGNYFFVSKILNFEVMEDKKLLPVNDFTKGI